MKEQRITINNETGVHARVAGIIVKEASQFKSQIEFKFQEKTANAKSIMSLLGLGLANHSEILLMAKGEDEEVAVLHLTQLLEKGFNH